MLLILSQYQIVWMMCIQIAAKGSKILFPKFEVKVKAVALLVTCEQMREFNW